MGSIVYRLGVGVEVNIKKQSVVGVKINGKSIFSDIVLSGADYHHTETLLPKGFRAYSEAYWDKKTFAPSSLLFYVGLNKKVKNVSHRFFVFQ